MTEIKPDDIFSAATEGDLDGIRRILDVYPDAACLEKTCAPLFISTTPLVCAVKNGHVEAARLLIEHGAKIDKNGAWPVLHSLVGDVSFGMMALFIENKYPPDIQDCNGMTALHRAVATDFENAPAARAIRLLLESGADVNKRDFDGNTPLHYAARNGRLRAARLLLEGGAKVDIRNNRECTALDFATQEGCCEIADLIRNHPALKQAAFSKRLSAVDKLSPRRKQGRGE